MKITEFNEYMESERENESESSMRGCSCRKNIVLAYEDTKRQQEIFIFS